MKTTLSILALSITSLCFGQAFKISESDIKQGQIGQRDGSHYVKLELKITQIDYRTDTIRILISQLDPGSSKVKYNTKEVAKVNYHDWQGNSAMKITFDYPDSLKAFNYRFQVNISNCAECDSISAAFWPSTTSLEDDYLASTDNIKATFWYDTNGKEIENPNSYEGVLIRKKVYFNGKVKSDRILDIKL
jgi:hypothetical protein